MRLGVIADDFTGATDIAGFLVNSGISTIQLFGVPGAARAPEADAYVVSLKSRSCPKDMAIRMSLDSLAWLRRIGCTHFYFKYCSTFDSTAEGNIGPVADALLERLGADFTVVCPSLPVNGRTVYKGYLFVHDELLHESGMRKHPVTPMRDSKLQRVLGSQTPGRVADIHTDIIDRGAGALKARLGEQKESGVRYVVLDTISDEHLRTIAEVVADYPLLTGGSGLGGAIAAVHVDRGRVAGQGVSRKETSVAHEEGYQSRGPAVILSGSCSTATNRQVQRYRTVGASVSVDPGRCVEDPGYTDELFEWAREHLEDQWAPLLYATSSPESLVRSQAEYGGAAVGDAIEGVFGDLARRLVAAGVRNIIVAGGETAGRVVHSLGLEAVHIGPQIAPGVPWTRAVDRDLCLALKSGNFGSDNFFVEAQESSHE